MSHAKTVAKSLYSKPVPAAILILSPSRGYSVCDCSWSWFVHLSWKLQLGRPRGTVLQAFLFLSFWKLDQSGSLTTGDMLRSLWYLDPRPVSVCDVHFVPLHWSYGGYCYEPPLQAMEVEMGGSASNICKLTVLMALATYFNLWSWNVGHE